VQPVQALVPRQRLTSAMAEGSLPNHSLLDEVRAAALMPAAPELAAATLTGSSRVVPSR